MVGRRAVLLGGVGALGAVALAACGADDPVGVDATDGRTEPGPADGPRNADDPVRLRIAYGDHDDAFGDLWLPTDPRADPVPVVVLIHGGFWRDGFLLDLMDGLAESVTGLGYAAWNIEYRRIGAGGGWPETFDDVAAAVDHVASLASGVDEGPPLDLDRVAVVGHSAGGHLAAWAASRHRLPAGAPGVEPVVRPVVAFPQAGVLDLVSCAQDRVGGSACPDLLGGTPDEVPERYAAGSPAALLPIGVPVVAVHGTRDSIVPPAQSAAYVDAAVGAGDGAESVTIDGADHFDVIDPTHPAWQAVLDRLPTSFG